MDTTSRRIGERQDTSGWEEITPGRQEGDSFSDWIKDSGNKDALVLDEEVDAGLVRTTLSDGYAADLTDQEMEALGRDPFLISYALVDVEGRCVVTAEVSKPRKQRQNRHIPDVCDSLGVSWCSPFFLYSSLDFRTDWES